MQTEDAGGSAPIGTGRTRSAEKGVATIWGEENLQGDADLASPGSPRAFSAVDLKSTESIPSISDGSAAPTARPSIAIKNTTASDH